MRDMIMYATNVMGICFVVYIWTKNHLKNNAELIPNAQNLYEIEL